MYTIFIPRIAYAYVLHILLVCSVAAQESFSDSRADDIESLLREHFPNGSSGMVIGIIDEQGSRVFSAGKLGNGTNQDVDGESIFEICSVTKVFTSLLLLEAVNRGELQLEDPVVNHLPEAVSMPVHGGKEITLAHLAAQESGLPFNPDRLTARGRVHTDSQTVDDLYHFLSNYELTTDPGSRFLYSNTGFALLGSVLERQSGMGYESLVTERISRPLEMESTFITPKSELMNRMTRGHGRNGGSVPHLELKAMASAGAIFSTANDLLRFLSANLGFNDSELTPLMTQMQVIRHRNMPRFGKTAMPWFDEGVYNPPGTEILAHGGESPGYRSFLGFDTKKRRGVVVLTNQTTFNPMGIGWTLLQDLPLTRHNITNWVREIVGLGMWLDVDEESGDLLITKVFPESPAGEAGLTSRFVIEKINDVSVRGKSLQDSLSILAGPAGTKVQLKLYNRDRKESKIVELTKRKYVTFSS